MTEEAVNNGSSGALIWSLRFHNKDGGFYFHHDGFKPVTSRSYHYPGFEENDDYFERAVIDMIKENSFRIQGISPQELTVPEAPVLLPIDESLNIYWRGSVSAICYDIERTESVDGTWIVIRENISDCREITPLFKDSNAEQGKTYYYRVKAKNSAGVSAPSNVEAVTTK